MKLPNDIFACEDVSAIAKFGSFLVIGSDENSGDGSHKNYIQFLKKDAAGNYLVHSNSYLFEGNATEGKEMDIESLAVEENDIYIIGSHSSKRQKVKATERYQDNIKTFRDSKIIDERNRDWLYRLKVDDNCKELAKEKITLRKIIKKDAVLKTFRNIPSKENGIDIEGIAVKDSWLYIGFRGPVFRNNYVPVMKLKFDDPKDSYELLYLQLGGRGIRDMTSVSDGFLIVAGAVGDGQDSYQLYHWDGKNVIPGNNRKPKNIGQVRLLGEIRPPESGKAEGVVVMQEDNDSYQLIIVYDGVNNKNNVIRNLRIDKM